MIHELIHILLTQNSSKIIKLINKKFKEDNRVKIHLPVLLIFRNVIANLYGKEYLERSFDMERDGELEKIWKIVKSINFNKNIIAYLGR
jgi:diphthamide synthase (EF-2-diphthine--ammonia ligase)